MASRAVGCSSFELGRAPGDSSSSLVAKSAGWPTCWRYSAANEQSANLLPPVTAQANRKLRPLCCVLIGACFDAPPPLAVKPIQKARRATMVRPSAGDDKSRLATEPRSLRAITTAEPDAQTMIVIRLLRLRSSPARLQRVQVWRRLSKPSEVWGRSSRFAKRRLEPAKPNRAQWIEATRPV